MNRKALALALINTILAALPATARSGYPPVPPELNLGSPTTFSFPSATLNASFDNNASSSYLTPAIHVAGAGNYLWDVDVIVNVEHQRSSQLDIYLVGPGGREVTLTTDNGGNYINVFAGRVFDDSSPSLARTHGYADNVSSPDLVPEGALGSFFGINPNNTDWKLRVVDGAVGFSAKVVNWQLRITTLPAAPTTGPFGPFGGFVNVNSTINDNSAGPMVVPLNLPTSSGEFVSELRIFAEIQHPDPRELEITLYGGFPVHPLTVLSAVQLPIVGPATPNVFNGTTWFDGARSAADANKDRPCTDEPFAASIVATELVPEGALSTLIGSEAWSWYLAIQDKQSGNVGQLVRWGVTFWTFDPPPPSLGYCVAGTNSSGCVSVLTTSGTAYQNSTTPFSLRVDGINGGGMGLLFYGITGQKYSAWGPFSVMCVKAPVQRSPVMVTHGTPAMGGMATCDGWMLFDWNAFYRNNPTVLGHPYVNNMAVDAQFWWRDPYSVKTTQLSDAVHFTVLP